MNNYKDLEILYTGDYAFISLKKSRLFGFRINLDDIENILKRRILNVKFNL